MSPQLFLFLLLFLFLMLFLVVVITVYFLHFLPITIQVAFVLYLLCHPKRSATISDLFNCPFSRPKKCQIRESIDSFQSFFTLINFVFYSLNLIKPVSPVFAPNVISIHRYADIQMGGKLPRGRPIVGLFDPKDPLFCQIDEIRSNDFWFS